ncbi:MAG TPA: hypothetical protein VMS09_07915 [Paenibacillus sp.]|uniref:hypothetical protein n=1 Tax=Paenibacillus sp. TaxID=58172 RepID=UPI002B9DE838|nr:hypothetical protein [Paenibacillus sp.]HUC91939.1 hypothetical protein [Paenibacillus sp.]
MVRMEEWLQHEFLAQTVFFVENRERGLFFRGRSRFKDVEVLVSASRHVWVREAGIREWKPTGVYVPADVISITANHSAR